MRRYRTRSKESGVTLIELLVVATIILTLAAVSVPTIKPMMADAALTEGVTDDNWNSYLSELDAAGVNDIVSIYQTAVDRSSSAK